MNDDYCDYDGCDCRTRDLSNEAIVWHKAPPGMLSRRTGKPVTEYATLRREPT